MREPKIEWDDWRGGMATFSGPGGFTQVAMSYRGAESIAEAMGVSFIHVPAFTTPEAPERGSADE